MFLLDTNAFDGREMSFNLALGHMKFSAALQKTSGPYEHLVSAAGGWVAR